ncbi:MAG TPA: TadE/TadG family type IV pilus assembly protein [Candidatus Acidoferrum sp.]|jgi:Flp pilus assembly protein TadG|nr:TadE/TadG family type IV pilus assembly protein [Candidatus Acidoferrum sp.]
MSRGQSLVELAVCAPLVVLLTLGTAAAVQLIDASAGLQAATQAAAAAASRAPDAASAESAGRARFQAMVADYPLRSPHLSITSGRFSRSDEVVATASGAVDISWAGLFLPGRLTLSARAVVPLEAWRSHGAPS